MPNALSRSLSTPPAPNPTPQQSDGQGLAPMPSIGPLSQGMGPAAPPQGAPQANAPPPPSHQQVVAALRHFNAIEKELTALLKNPDVGKSDLKSATIDGTTKLVSQGIMTPANAVTMLGTFPERPFDQKQWLESHLVQTVQAATAVLSHRQAGAAAEASAGQPSDTTPPDPNDHANAISGLMGQYKGQS